jgi:hypothetical protein
MSNEDLVRLVRDGDQLRAAAVFELIDRTKVTPELIPTLESITHLQVARDDRLFHRVSLAWAPIIGLLSMETPQSRRAAYRAFYALPETDQQALLAYLKCPRIEDCHPPGV